MIGLIVHLHILVKRLEEGVLEGLIIRVLFVSIFDVGVVLKVILVSLLMVFLSVGYILVGIKYIFRYFICFVVYRSIFYYVFIK